VLSADAHVIGGGHGQEGHSPRVAQRLQGAAPAAAVAAQPTSAQRSKAQANSTSWEEWHKELQEKEGQEVFDRL